MDPPELGNRPLLATARDQALAVPRAEVRKTAELARRGLNVLLVGDRGAGTTSALHSIAFALREEGRAAEVVDAAPAAGLEEVVRAVDAQVARRDPAPSAIGRSATGAVLDAVRRWRALEEGRTVLLDGLAPELAQPLFGRLRDELWQTPLRFVVAASAADAAAFLTPPADAFFEARVRLEPLRREQQRDLLRRRLAPADADRALRALGDVDLGTPRELLDMARRALIDGAGEGEIAAAARRRADRVARLGPAAARLLAELEALGGASASDPRLLTRLGWSRQRAAQVARTLEEAGLVAGAPTRGEDRRVRRVFTPVSPLATRGAPG